MTETTQPTEPRALTAKDLEAANQAGQWMAWTGLGLALLWWIGAVAGTLILFGPNTFSEQPAEVLVAGSVFALLPGLLMLMAGFLARQTKRTASANLLLLNAADRLLSPARQASMEIADLGQVARNTTIGINRTVNEALTAMKTTSQAMADERLRAESVSYAMADNARELTRRLAEERAALETLSKALNDQTETLNKAIPRQAAAMVEAAKAASAEVARADNALEMRLEELKQAGSTLAVRLIDLDAVARDAAKRTEGLNASVARIEQKLEQSQKTIQMAERASEMAVDAAASTGTALRDAVSSALDGARDANREISEATEQIQARATKAMLELASAGKAAAQAAARVQEQSHAIGTELRGKTPPSRRDTSPDEDVFETAAPGPASLPSETVPAPVEAHNDYPFDEDLAKPDKAYLTRDDDLFDTSGGPESPADADTGRDAMPLGNADTPVLLNQSLDEVPQPSELTEDAPPSTPIVEREPAIVHRGGEGPHGQSSEWRDIIADIGNEAEPPTRTALPQDNDTLVQMLVDRLEDSGIQLSKVFKSRDKKKIAQAARKDNAARRAAIRAAASGEIDRVAIRLRKDASLRDLAIAYVQTIEGEALKTLEDTGRNGRNASATLAAYLLIDAAIGDTLIDRQRQAG